MQRNHLSAKARTLITGLQRTGIDFSTDNGIAGHVWRALDEGASKGMTVMQLSQILDAEGDENPFDIMATGATDPAVAELHAMAYMLLQLFCASTGDCFDQAGGMLAHIHAKTNGRDVANDADTEFAWGCLNTAW